jgi:hypothetical protein
MKLTPSLSNYPIFPDWVFEGQLPIDNNIANSVLSDVQAVRGSSNFIETSFGWCTDRNVRLGENILKLNKLIGSIFYETAAAHFRLTQHNKDIQVCESWLYGIKPTHSIPQIVIPHRWYQAILFLNSSANSSKLYLELNNSKVYATPPGVQNFHHTIEPAQHKIVFIPSYIPWGFSPNNSDTDSLVFCNSFIIKHHGPLPPVAIPS